MNILVHLKLDSADFEKGAARTQMAFRGLETAATGGATAANATAAGLNATASAATKAGAALATTKSSADKVVTGLGAANAMTGMLSGTITGTASGAIGLAAALKGLGVAAVNPITLTVALAASLVLLAKQLDVLGIKARQLNANISFKNAESGIENLSRRFDRLMETMEGTLSLMRELRGITAQADDIEYEKKLAENELARKRELSAIAPGDAEAEKAINQRYDKTRAGLEFDREAAGNTATAEQMRRERDDNAKAIAARRKRIEEISESAANATRNATFYSTQATGFGPNKAAYQEKADQFAAQAKSQVSEAEKIRSEIEQLERKNTVLAEQAALYEKRNEVVEIRRKAERIPSIAETGSKSDEKDGKGVQSISSMLNVPTDRLTRIGGMMGNAQVSPVETKRDRMNQIIADNTKRMADLMARNAIRNPVPAWG